MLYYGKPWTENEKKYFWNKSQIQRFEDSSSTARDSYSNLTLQY